MIEIYDKVATNETCRNKIGANECYDYIDGWTFIGFSMFIYFIFYEILPLWGTRKESLVHFFVTFTPIGEKKICVESSTLIAQIFWPHNKFYMQCFWSLDSFQ
jgi:hypothetical protein